MTSIQARMTLQKQGTWTYCRADLKLNEFYFKNSDEISDYLQIFK